MIFGSTEILICIVPAFIVIDIIGVWLLLQNRRDKNGGN